MSGLLNWYASPEVQLGMGLLSANNGQKGSLMKGLQTGMNNAAVMQQRQAEEKQKQLKLQQAADQRAWMTQNMPTYADAPPPVQEAAIAQRFRALKERGMHTDVNGYQYWDDTNERVHPGAVKKRSPLVEMNTPLDMFGNEMKLRKEFQGLPDVKSFYAAKNAYQQIEAALDNPSAASSLAAATKFMKILDPGSVVRESELVMAMQATGKLDAFMNTFNRWKTGEALTPLQIQDFKRTSALLFNEAVKHQDKRVREYRSLATSYKFDPNRIVAESHGFEVPVDLMKISDEELDEAIRELESKVGGNP